ncbi:MAG: hypothetical protein IJV07_03500 [Alphaproteobacteria bacterium]|nr:hypothetical protein [Alphaproteobacteria bacterium]
MRIGFNILFCLIFIVAISVGQTASADFLPGTDDIPLMDGLSLPETNDFAFDTPAGQILAFDADTSFSQKQVLSFYQKTLTAMGWEQSKSNHFKRGNDTLILSFPKKGSVHFDITLATPGH